MKFVLLEDLKSEKYTGWLFENPVDEICITNPADFIEAFVKIKTLQKQGLFACGYISYEAGFLLLNKLRPRLTATTIPLMHFLFFTERKVINADEREQFLVSKINAQDLPLVLYDFNFLVTKETYLERFEKLQNHLKAGNTYQVNLTSRYHFQFQGNPAELYKVLGERQSVEYAGYFQFDDYVVLSLSPELFFKKTDSNITVRPMKGTSSRNKNPELDQQSRDFLVKDEKNKAENIIIVDLLRNDLSRISKTGSVKVKQLCAIETYETVFQMTSTIEGEVKPDIEFKDVLQALFPCGSITGAPKISTMKIIQDLECVPRGIYTGAVGFITPENDMSFNVAIRSIYLKNKQGTLGVGGGITIRSEGSSEWEEMHLKARFLTQLPKGYCLIETMAWLPNKGYVFLNEHIQRLLHSAHSLSFICDVEKITNDLNSLVKSFCDREQLIRLVLSSNGQCTITHHDLESYDNTTMPIALSKNSINSDNILFKYKTNHPSTRGFYNSELARIQASDRVFDVIFQNQAGYLTEGTRFNLLLDLNDGLFTPRLNSGLLTGLYLQDLLNKRACFERDLTTEDLNRAKNIYLLNSVRGMIKARFIGAR